MSETNQLVANVFTKISHHRNVSAVYLTQNLFDKNKKKRTISLNAHYLVLFKNPRDATQFATLARQMYPNASKFAIEAYTDATSAPYAPADRPETRTRQAMSSENDRVSRRHAVHTFANKRW